MSVFVVIDGFIDKSYCCARFGEGSEPIHIYYPSCSGTERKLVDCSHSQGLHNDHRGWSVKCNNGKHVSVVIHHNCFLALTSCFLPTVLTFVPLLTITVTKIILLMRLCIFL